jgi:hypothetical protein
MGFDATFQEIAGLFREQFISEAGIRVPAVVGSVRARGRRAAHCSAAGWVNATTGDTIPEIALNPVIFTSDRQSIIAAIVHELLHAVDWENGTMPARGRHGAKWMQMMRKVGLEPVVLDSPTTRYSVTQQVIRGGLVDRVVNEMSPSIDFEFVPQIALDASRSRKCTYRAACCGMTAYGKPGLSLRCAVHNQLLKGAS